MIYTEKEILEFAQFVLNGGTLQHKINSPEWADLPAGLEALRYLVKYVFDPTVLRVKPKPITKAQALSTLHLLAEHIGTTALEQLERFIQEQP